MVCYFVNCDWCSFLKKIKKLKKSSVKLSGLLLSIYKRQQKDLWYKSIQKALGYTRGERLPQITESCENLLAYFLLCLLLPVNKHKPWIETSYHGVITENMDTVLLDPPLVALDKDAPTPYAGTHFPSLSEPRLPLSSMKYIIVLLRLGNVSIWNVGLNYRDLEAPFLKHNLTDALTSVLFQSILYSWHPDCTSDTCL